MNFREFPSNQKKYNSRSARVTELANRLLTAVFIIFVIVGGVTVLNLIEKVTNE